jgi:hypothetical protein
MAVSIFISSTGADMDEDCRPFVRRAITEGGAIEVCMESWVTDFDEAGNVCRRKLRESSHYLGIFGHWRGSCPPGEDRSYTEAEFDWACELTKQKAVLVPKVSSEIDRKLRRRARAQNPAAAEAQKRFVKRVRDLGVTVNFDDLPHLVQKTTQLLNLWQGRGVVGEGARARAGGSTPTEADLDTLGRRELVEQFGRAFDLIGGEGLAEVAAFVVHGPGGSGHAQAVRRLRAAFEGMNGDAEARRCVLPIGAHWDGDSLTGLLAAFAREVDRDWRPNNVAELAARAGRLLEAGHLLLEIYDLQRYRGGLRAFVEEFWRPLSSALGGRTPAHRLAALMSFEGAPVPDWASCTFDPVADDEADFELARPVKLPALTPFTAQELTTWLRGWLRGVGAFGGDAARQTEGARALAQTLVAETGGEPLRVYGKLSLLVAS